MPVPMLPPTLSAAAASDVRSPMEIQSFSVQCQTGVCRVDIAHVTSTTIPTLTVAMVYTSSHDTSSFEIFIGQKEIDKRSKRTIRYLPYRASTWTLNLVLGRLSLSRLLSQEFRLLFVFCRRRTFVGQRTLGRTVGRSVQRSETPKRPKSKEERKGKSLARKTSRARERLALILLPSIRPPSLPPSLPRFWNSRPTAAEVSVLVAVLLPTRGVSFRPLDPDPESKCLLLNLSY